jgi:hypothetical protein
MHPLDARAMIIRPLAAADGAQFRRLRLEALERHPEAFWESHAEFLRDDAAAVAARLADMAPPAAIFGAFVDEALVGSIGFAVEPRTKVRHKGRIWGVYVTAEQRRRGVAQCAEFEVCYSNWIALRANFKFKKHTRINLF